MRRLTAALASLALALGFTVVVAGTASADITAPANNAVLRGDATLSDSGGYDGSSLDHCSWFGGDGGDTRIQLINSSNHVVFERFWNTGGARSVTIDTHDYDNGAYIVRGRITIRKNSGWLGLGCKNTHRTTERSVRIENVTSIDYTGATSAPRNTSVTVSARLTDPHKSPREVAGKTVSFTLSGGATVTDSTNSSGVATATLPITGSARNATVTARFAGDRRYVGASDAAAFAVTKNDTRTTLDAPADVVHGQSTGFTARVAPTNGSGTPDGTIQFTVDGDDFGDPVPLTGGVASSAATSTLSTGDHTIGAHYSGSGNFFAGDAATVTQRVGKAATTVTLTDQPTVTVHGQKVVFAATVDVVAPGAGEPTGGVQFDVDGQPYGTAVALDGDTARLEIADLDAGNHDVVATYNGDGDFARSSSARLTHGVDRASTALALSSSDTTAVAGQPLAYTARVTPTGEGGGEPGGVVRFFADGEQIGDPVTLQGGVATSATTKLSAGVHQITANYEGNGNFAGSDGAIAQEVDAAATRTTVGSTPNPSIFGQPVEVRAVVTPVAPATGTPEGVVEFIVDGASSGRFVTLDGGEATTTLTGLAVGAHAIRARYLSGDADFVTSTSAELTQQVNKAATATTLKSSSPTSVFGQPVTFEATVTVQAPGAGTPTGTVTFTDGGEVIGTAEIDASTGGVATVTTADLSVAQHAIVATYAGDESFLGSGGSVTQTVRRAETSTLLTSSVNPAKSGQGVRFSATVTPVEPGAGHPTGTVRFTVNGSPLGDPVEVVDGAATSSAFASLTPGTYQIEAAYSGDRNFRASAGSLDQGAGLEVSQAATSMTLTSSDDSTAYGDPVTFTAEVAAVEPATGVPSGVVQFWEGGELLGATNLAPAGEPNTARASFVVADLAPGAHDIRAVYVGSFNFAGQTAGTTQQVGLVPTRTGLGSAENPSTYGDDVTLTAVVSTGLPAAGVPEGTVTFTEGDTVLGTADVETVDGRRQASLTVAGLHAGEHTVTAAYSGGGAFAPSVSGEYVQHVDRAASTLQAATVLTHVGANGGEVSATLTGVDGRPLAGETLRFGTTQNTDHSTIFICDAVTDQDGVARCDATSEAAAMILDGGYDVEFAGNADHLGARDHGTYVVED